MIIDTDVLIDYFRGSDNAKNIIARNIPFSISAITLMELLQGSRDKEMSAVVERQFRVWGVTVIQISESVSIRAIQFVREFALSHGMQAMDALIAATAIVSEEELLTGNAKHFRNIPGLHVRSFEH
jgi:predicted nucleic acid-binding protein